MEDALRCHLRYGTCVCKYPPRIYLTTETEYLKLELDNFDLSEIMQWQSGQC